MTMPFELTEEELKKTQEYYKKILKYKIYDEKGNLINGRRDIEFQPITKKNNEDLGEYERE